MKRRMLIAAGIGAAAGIFLCAAVVLVFNRKLNDIGGQLQQMSGQLEALGLDVEEAGGSRIIYDMDYNSAQSTEVKVSTDIRNQVYRFYQLPLQTGNQGMSYVIETPEGELVVIDGGFKGDGEYLMNFLSSKGGKVAAWIITHPHVDHVGAFLYYLEAEDKQGIEVEQVYYSPFTSAFFQEEEEGKDLKKVNEYVLFDEFEAARTAHTEITFTPMLAGDQLEIAGVQVSCLHSFDPTIFDVNSNSLVMKLEIKGYQIMITGDLTDGTIDRIVSRIGESGEYWRVNCLQAPHHGFGGNTDWIFRLTEPELVTMDLSLHQYYDRDEEGHLGEGHLGTQEMVRYLEEAAIPVLKSFYGPNVIVID